jgi:hypothetical protein
MRRLPPQRPARAPIGVVADNLAEGQPTAELTRQSASSTAPSLLEATNSQLRTPPSLANSQHNLPSQSQSQVDYDTSDLERAPITHIHHSAREQPATCPLPTFSFDWRSHGIDYIPPPSRPNPNIANSRANDTQHEEHDCLIAVDGAFQGTRGTADYRTAGIAFLIHVFPSRQTYIGGRFLPLDDGENSAPVAEAEATLAAFTFAHSINMKRPLIVHDNQDMTNFLTGRSTNTRASGGRYSRLKNSIKRITSYLDTASCSHVKSHTNDRLRLEENGIVDELAVFFRKNPGLTLEPQILNMPLHDKLLSLFPNANDIPTIACPRLNRQNGIRCTKCGSPGHEHHTCFLLKYSCTPRKCVFTRIQPPRSLSFSESFRNPKDIDWTNGPASIDDCTYVHFVSTMSILATKQSTSAEANQAFTDFGRHYHYNYVSRKLVRTTYKPDSLCAENRLTADTLLTQLAEDEAKKILGLAKLCELRHWKKAMQYIHREERVSPLDHRIEEEWAALHPQAPNPEDELHIPYNPSSFKLFHIEREVIKEKIASWDITNAGGLNGFTPALIIHFYNLTARQEDPQDLNPHFTSFLVFLEYLASGKLSDMRNNALNYRSVMINKSPTLKLFKARNISIGDAFTRLANYSVLVKSIRPAKRAGLLSDADLGSLVKNGVEKFVKTGQLADSENCLIFSCDMTKGYNNILRTTTWDAIKQIDFQPLTQLFTYLYGTSPILNYIIDPSKPVTAENIRKAILLIGLPQGDNLSGFLFSITLNYILQALWTRHGTFTTQVGYDSILDDIKIAIPSRLMDRSGNMIADLIITLSNHNFNINLSKSELYIRIPSPLAQQQAAIINTSTHNAGLVIGDLKLNSTGFSVCRVPIGTPAFIHDYTSNNYKPRVTSAFERFRYLWKAIDRIPREKYNTFFVFIRLCFSSRFTYWLRTLTPQFARPIASFIDEHTQTLIEHLYPQRPNLPAPDDEFREQLRISKLIEKLPLSKGGAGVPSMTDLVDFCHTASCVESFSYVSSYGNRLGVYPPAVPLPSDDGSSFRERLFTGFTQSVNKILAHNFPSFTPSFFKLKAQEFYTNIQAALTSSFHTLLQSNISDQLMLPSYKGWFEGGKEQYTSFTLNSQVRHITRIRPPQDSIFRTVLSMRVLRPLFHGVMCKCGKILDPCGHHALRCIHTPYTNIHHGVRDGCLKWMQMYIRRQHNSPFKVISETDSQSQCELANYYAATSSLLPNTPASGRRSDGILWALNDPLRPWAIDFVQTQTTTDKLDARLRDLDKKYADKIKIYSDSHPTIPPSRIVPFVFTSDGVLHPKTEEFMDWFICKAASIELMEPPSNEKISFRHAFLSSLQDKTAFLITSCFETSLKEAHASMFPLSHNEPPNPIQYSDPSNTPGCLFDSQPTPSPPRPPPNPTVPPHPLAPRDPSSLSSVLLPYTPTYSPRRSQRLLPPAATTDATIQGNPHTPPNAPPPPPILATVPPTALPARGRSTSACRASLNPPPPTPASITTPSTPALSRARSTPTGAHQSHSGLYPPALSGVGALFRAHLPSVGRKGSGR